MKSYSSREIISLLEEGSHKQFKHTTKKGRVTVNHPTKDMNIKTIKSIERQSGIKF